MAKKFDVNNFVIDHVIRGLMTSTADGSVMWSINQITEPTLNVTSETAEATDALGSAIATFNRGKKAEFSANNSLFDLGLFASQNGVEKEVAGAGKKVIVPAFETITVPTPNTNPVTLKNKPNATPKEIYRLKGDGTLGDKLTYNASAAPGKFAYDTSKNQITFHEDVEAGAEYFIQYEYAADGEDKGAVAVTGDAINFPKAGKFIMEVLGTDVCDPTTLIHAFVVFPNAKLDANVDISFATDGNHPFKLIAQQAYCDSKKTLFQIVIPEEA